MVHDGELADVCGLLRVLGLNFIERLGEPTHDERAADWELVVATPKRLLQVTSRGESGTVRLAIVENETRTLLASMRRARVDLVVRRPVHPAALRLLLLHALYRGPEKRGRQRVSIGAPVRFRGRLRRRPAVLADLSMRGCRLLSKHAAKRDSHLTVILPAGVTGDRALSLAGKVVRTGPASGEDSGTQAIALVFDPASKDVNKRVENVLRRYVGGPAVLAAPVEDEPQVAARGEVAPQDAPRVEAPRALRRETGVVSPPEPNSVGLESSSEDDFADVEAAHDANAADDRRGGPRHSYQSRVIALGNEATKVLIGRDISLGGMRVDANASVSIGDELRIAIHIRTRTEPLVVHARVDRDDGDAGMVLKFFDLSESSSEYLQKMVNYLPILSARASEDGTEPGVIVSEILGPV